MAGDNKQEYPPLLRPGFHLFDIHGVTNLCVHRFRESTTRPKIMKSLETVISAIQRSHMHGEVWIDGSFLTEKLNPEDSDIILVIDKADYDKMDVSQKDFLRWFGNTSLSQSHYCDNYVMIRDNSAAESEYMYAYWLRQFGFSRGNEMKGLAVIKIPFVVVP